MSQLHAQTPTFSSITKRAQNPGQSAEPAPGPPSMTIAAASKPWSRSESVRSDSASTGTSDVDLILSDDGKNDPFEIRPSVRRGVDVSPKGHISALGVGVKVDPAFDLSGPVRWQSVHAGANYRKEGDGLLADPGHRPPSHRSRTGSRTVNRTLWCQSEGVKVSELLELWLGVTGTDRPATPP